MAKDANNEQEENTSLLPKRHHQHSSMVDRGWAWMVLIGSSLCGIISLGISSNVGVLYVDIQNDINASLIETSLIGSLQTGSLFVSVSVTSPLAHRMGCRVAALCGSIATFAAFMLCYFVTALNIYYACLGIIAGVGLSLGYSSAIVSLNDYFDKRRSFAILIFLSASGIGILAFGPLTSSLLNKYGLEGTLLILASFGLTMAVGAMLFFPLHHGDSKNDDKKTSICGAYLDKELWNNLMFYIMTLSAFMYGLAYIIAFTLLPDYMASKGIPLSSAALSITAIGITSMVARFAVGFVANNHPGLNRWMYIFSGVFAGGSMFIIPICQSAIQYQMVAGVFGIFYGVVSGLLPVLLVELFGSRKLPISFGLVMMIFGVGTCAGSPVAGIITENTSLIGAEFVFGGASFTVSGFLLIPTLIDKCHRQAAYYKSKNEVNEVSSDERQYLIPKNDHNNSVNIIIKTYDTKL